MEEIEFYKRFLELYRDVDPKIASSLENMLPDATTDLEDHYLRYISFSNSLIDHLPEFYRGKNREVLFVGGESDSENLAIMDAFPKSRIHVSNAQWSRFCKMSTQLIKNKYTTLGKDKNILKRAFDAVILHHVRAFSSGVDAKKMYETLKRVMNESNVCFASYYHEEELNEAMTHLAGNKILYSGKNKRSKSVDFRGHYPKNLGYSDPDSYVLVFQKR